MTRNSRRALSVLGLVAIVVVASSCEMGADCSWIDQPDMGGLLCVGTNFLAFTGGLLAIVIALLASIPV